MGSIRVFSPQKPSKDSCKPHYVQELYRASLQIRYFFGQRRPLVLLFPAETTTLPVALFEGANERGLP